MLTCDEVVVGFGKVLALNGASFDLEAGQRVAIIGPNGAGKSTSVRTIAGLHRPASGRIVFRGQNIAARPVTETVRRGISLIPQGRRLFGSMSVRENLEMGAFTGPGPRQARADIDEWLDILPDLREKLDQPAGQLSGGQQQLVALVRGLMARPQLLMLDEPSMGISPATLDRVGDVLRRLNAEQGLTILLVEQNIAFAFTITDRVLVLVRGRVVEDAPPAYFANEDVLARHFFGVSS